MNRILAREAGLPVSLEHHYKFLMLLPLEADEKIEVVFASAFPYLLLVGDTLDAIPQQGQNRPS